MVINEIYLGNAYELIKQVPDKSVDLIMTDPPYQMKNIGGGGIAREKSRQKHFEEMRNSDLGKGVDLKILDEFMRIMKVPNCYIWCNKHQIYDYLDYFVKKNKCNFDIIVWAKSNPIPLCNGHYLADKEYCLYFYKNTKPIGDAKSLKTVYITPLNVKDKKKYGHPTIKPEEIVNTLIKNSCRGGLVFDPFVGSGTTCAVAKKLGFNYLGFEINEEYYKIAKDRLNGFDKNGNMELF